MAVQQIIAPSIYSAGSSTPNINANYNPYIKPVQNAYTGGNTQQTSGISASDLSGLKNAIPSSNNGTGILSQTKQAITSGVDKFGTQLGFAPSVAGINAPANAANFAFANAAADASLPWSAAGTSQAAINATQSAPLPWSAGGSSTFGGTLSGTLGAAGVGFLGGSLIAKFTGGNQMGGSVGGALGGAIAGAAALGPIGIGAAIIAGGLGGSLFGNQKPSDKTQVGGLNFQTGAQENLYKTTQSSTGSKFSQDNADIRDKAQVGASNLVQFLNQNGAKLKSDSPYANTNMILKVGSRDGYQVGFQGDKHALNYVTNTKDPGQFLNDINNTVLSQYDVPEGLKKYLQEQDLSQFYTPNFAPSKLSFDASGNVMTQQATSDALNSVPDPVKSGPSPFDEFLKNYKATINAPAPASPTTNPTAAAPAQPTS